VAAPDVDRVRFTQLMRTGPYRWLWLADAQSNLGDQLARVALAVLVYQQTGSDLLTSSTYALTFLPTLLGGVLLSGIADRYSRRSVMVTCDLVRAALLALMAVPHMPLAGVISLLVVAVLLGSPFNAAQAAVLPDLLDGERYTGAMALKSITSQLAQLAGFAGGGVLIAALGPRIGLTIDAVTFAGSAVIVQCALTRHPLALRKSATQPVPYLDALRRAVRLVTGDPRLMCWLGLALLVGFYVVPEGIAAPLAASVDIGTTGVGIIMAAAPAGTALGAFLFVRFVPPSVRARAVGPLAAATGLPMAAFVLKPDAHAAVGLLFVSGVFTAYLVEAVSSFTRTVPTDMRGQVVGLAASTFLVVQGLGLMLAGVSSDLVGPAPTIAVSGTLGVVLGAVLSARLRSVHSSPR